MVAAPAASEEKRVAGGGKRNRRRNKKHVQEQTPTDSQQTESKQLIVPQPDTEQKKKNPPKIPSDHRRNTLIQIVQKAWQIGGKIDPEYTKLLQFLGHSWGVSLQAEQTKDPTRQFVDDEILKHFLTTVLPNYYSKSRYPLFYTTLSERRLRRATAEVGIPLHTLLHPTRPQ
jgi:hypothetical protein